MTGVQTCALPIFDASKAFERVILFLTLMNNQFPIIFIKVIINLYSTLRTIVRWNGFESANLPVLSGVRQGVFYRLYYLTVTLIALSVI